MKQTKGTEHKKRECQRRYSQCHLLDGAGIDAVDIFITEGRLLQRDSFYYTMFLIQIVTIGLPDCLSYL